MKRMHAALSGDPARWHVVRAGSSLPDGFGGSETQWLVGRIAAKGLSDEIKGAFYAVIETPTGAAYHLPLDARSASALSTGDLVSFASKRLDPVLPVDHRIAEIASSHAASAAPLS